MFPFSYFIYDFLGELFLTLNLSNKSLSIFSLSSEYPTGSLVGLSIPLGKMKSSQIAIILQKQGLPILKFCLHLLAEFYQFTHVDILRPRYLNNILIEEWKETLE